MKMEILLNFVPRERIYVHEFNEFFLIYCYFSDYELIKSSKSNPLNAKYLTNVLLFAQQRPNPITIVTLHDSVKQIISAKLPFKCQKNLFYMQSDLNKEKSAIYITQILSDKIHLIAIFAQKQTWDASCVAFANHTTYS